MAVVLAQPIQGPPVPSSIVLTPSVRIPPALPGPVKLYVRVQAPAVRAGEPSTYAVVLAPSRPVRPGLEVTLCTDRSGALPALANAIVHSIRVVEHFWVLWWVIHPLTRQSAYLFVPATHSCLGMWRRALHFVQAPRLPSTIPALSPMALAGIDLPAPATHAHLGPDSPTKPAFAPAGVTVRFDGEDFIQTPSDARRLVESKVASSRVREIRAVAVAAHAL